MIRTEQEYRATLKRMEEARGVAAQQRTALQATGLAQEDVERAMQPVLAFYAQLEEEIAWYEQVKRGDIGVISRLTAVGRLLIALRIAAGLTQRELALRLGVDESQVSRDERNEYYGVTLERAQRVADALGARLETRVAGGEDHRRTPSGVV